MVRNVRAEFVGKQIVRILWDELLPITQFWSRCFDQFNSSRESQQRAAHRLRSLQLKEAKM